VKKDSMYVEGEFREQNFPDAQLKGYNKQQQSMATVKIGVAGVAALDLQVLATKALEEVRLHLPSKGVASIMVMCLAPEWIVFNKHWLFREKDSSEHFADSTFSIEMRGIKHEFNVSELKSTEDVELFALKHDFPVLSRSIHKFLPIEPVKASIDVVHVSKRPAVNGVARLDSYVSGGRSYSSLQWKEAGIPGMCGEPILGQLHGTAILVGLVGYGRDGQFVGCTLLSQKWFESVIDNDPYPFVDQVELFGTDFTKLNGLSERSEFRNVVSPFIVPMGSAAGATNSFTSRLRKSRIHDEVSERLSVKFGKPSTLKAVLDGEYYSAMTNTFKNVNMNNDITFEEIDTVTDSMVDRMASELFINEKSIKLSPMSMGAAIFGDSTINVARTDFKTSVGPILKEAGVKSKYDMFSLVEEESTPQEEVYVMLEMVKDLITGYDSMLRMHILFTVFGDFVAKDEVRPEEKLQKAKVRLFCVLCAALNIYVRMYLMPIIQFLLNYPEISECYGGINAGSVAWNKLAERLNVPGYFHFDMDFETFDTSHDSRIFRAAAMFFKKVAARIGYTNTECELVYLMVMCFKYQIIRWMKDYAFKFKGMPSGCIFTLIMNSFVNSFLLRVAYLRLVNDNNFDQKVRTANVGDDNVNAVCKSLYERFNMITIAGVYRGLGYVATPAKKGAALQKSIPFLDLTFLKRKFLWSAETGTYLAPLDKDSIYKSFCFEFKDAGVSPVQRLADVAQGAQREMFLHGRKDFEEFCSFMSSIYFRHQLVWHQLVYDDLLNEYMNDKFSTYL